MTEISKRRATLRKDCLLLVDYTVEGRPFNDYVRNISEAGAFIQGPVRTSYSRGRQIVMVIYRTWEQKPVKVEGRIAWVSPEGVGVSFLQPRHLRELKNLIGEA